MKRCISYSLFGYGRSMQSEGFDFLSYIRGLMVNIRMNRLLYPDWEIVLNLDNITYVSFKDLFDNIGIQIRVNEPAPLCLAMLWRLKPVFETEGGKWKYSHVICRDLDGPPTYREVQAVTYWINRDKAMHAITDSVSHNLPLMGGMIGIRPAYFCERVAQSWEEMIKKSDGISYERKGADQTFLNKYIYPKFAQHGNDSITQHYFNGLGDTFLSDFKTCKCPPIHGHEARCENNIEPGIPFTLSESNSTCGHIGAAGYYPPVTFKFLRKFKSQFEDLIPFESAYPDVFHWVKDGTFND